MVYGQAKAALGQRHISLDDALISGQSRLVTAAEIVETVIESGAHLTSLGLDIS